MLRSIKLQSLIYRSFLTSSLVPLFAIELLLLLLYFGVNAYLSDHHQNAFVEEVVSNLEGISIREANLVDGQLAEVSRMAALMQRAHEDFFAHPERCKGVVPTGLFRTHPNGALYKAFDNGGASLYFSASTAATEAVLRKAWCSEQLDPMFKALVNQNPLVSQAYLNTWDDMNRLYPFMENAPVQYGSGLHMEDYNFYFLADKKHNPERKPVWTSVYLDPAGQGWLVSVIVPVYRGDFLEGVSGLDITIDTFVRAILDAELPRGTSRFLVDQDGVILAMPESVEQLLKLKELRHPVAVSAIRSTVEKPEEFNLLKSSNDDIRRKMTDVLNDVSPNGQYSLSINGADYLLNSQRIPTTGWHIITLVDQATLLAPMSELHSISNQVGFVAISIMVVFYVLFFLYLENKSRHLAKRVADPIERLSNLTSSLGDQLVMEKLTSVGIAEIDRLYGNFNRMSSQLEQKTQALVDSETREEVRRKETEILERLAITDRLTGLYNRRKLDEVLTCEVERSNRFGHPFSIVMLDIDHFKNVNDTHGHPVGDQVIVELATLLREFIRKIDIVGRWGGEEFVIVCPMTDMVGASQLAEKLRVEISSHHFPVIEHLTASFGIASSMAEKHYEPIIDRADQGLYDAKRSGRNRVGVRLIAPRNDDGALL